MEKKTILKFKNLKTLFIWQMSKWEAVVSYCDQKSLFWFVRFTSMMIVDVEIHEKNIQFFWMYFHGAAMQQNAGRRLKTITPLIFDLFLFLSCPMYF